MRPFRLVILLACCVLSVTILLLITSQSSYDSRPTSTEKKSTLRSLFSFHSPLFPPSAIISLTDDNSTFFLARPAAFGPSLPSKGLSGQLWIGSGFGEDHIGNAGTENVQEGELGCSDVPNWDASLGRVSDPHSDGQFKEKLASSGKETDSKNSAKSAAQRREESPEDESTDDESSVRTPANDDGTDDYLSEHLGSSSPMRGSTEATSNHADIQSLQESAEIQGKVVLLSRGGCGFLEKVKWAQRRGGVALIVGDDIRGGPLVTMYAKGDTSNVTIPALFTSHTTAHLLSSLMPTNGRAAAFPSLSNGNGASSTKTGQSKDSKKPTQPKEDEPTKKVDSKPATEKNDDKASTKEASRPKSSETKSGGGFWSGFFSFFGFGSSDRNPHINTRPPSSGSHDWVVEEFRDEKPKESKKSSKEADRKDSKLGESTGPSADNFVIGVHDWRDPDLLKKPNQAAKKPAKRTMKSKRSTSSKDKPLSGGSITPGSGEYSKERPPYVPDGSSHKTSSSWRSHLPWSGNEETSDGRPSRNRPSTPDTSRSKPEVKPAIAVLDEPPAHEGLWVTLTPTNMSSSPFFDTILVLVVSPLVTLTIVYALLLLRSRIRRRRWRAPKSVVDRLPVRTYHTLSNESSPSLTTPLNSTPTTPLLQSTTGARISISRPHSRSRPRSRTTSDMHEHLGSTSNSLHDDSDNVSMTESEKRERGLAEWRRRYGGRQKECVVCLEEYVDGISRVMSLPCGHEFHVECITPWLTTRRRTCPICKGDVVRSMARSTGTSHPDDRILSRQSSFGRNFDDEEDVQDQVAGLRNDSPSAQEPVPTDDEDLERGTDTRFRLPNIDVQAWRSWLLEGLGLDDRGRRILRDVDRDR